MSSSDWFVSVCLTGLIIQERPALTYQDMPHCEKYVFQYIVQFSLTMAASSHGEDMLSSVSDLCITRKYSKPPTFRGSQDSNRQPIYTHGAEYVWLKMLSSDWFKGFEK